MKTRLALGRAARLMLALVWTTLLAASAAAQDFTGTYRDAEAPQDELQLKQDAAGGVRGAFVEAGTRTDFEGEVVNGELRAEAVTPDGIRFRMKGVLAGQTLRLTVFPLGIDGNVISGYEDTLVYERTSGGATPADQAGGFFGNFADGKVKVLLVEQAGRYTGAFEIAGHLYPLEARAQAGGGIEGTLAVGQQRYGFTATLAGDVLALRSDGAAFQLRRGSPPSTTGNPLAAGVTQAIPSGPKPGYKTVRHSLGFSLQHPESWQVVEAQGGMQITPPDVQQTAFGPAEYYIVTAAPADGISRPDDPQVQEYLAGLLTQSLGVELQAEGRVQKVKAGPRDAAIMNWKGTFPGAGSFRARAYVVLMSGYGVTLFGVGPPDQIDRRDKALREIVSTFSYEAQQQAATIEAGAVSGDVDPRMVGTWYRLVYRSSVLGGISSSFHQTMILAPDGKLSWVDQTVLSGEQRPLGASSGWTFSGIPESEVNRGRWTASGSTCRMTWNGGAAVYSVHVQGAAGRREMLLTPQGGGEKELWTEYAN